MVVRKDNDEKEEYFIEFIAFYQGKQYEKPSDEAYKYIDKEIDTYNINKKDLTKKKIKTILEKYKCRQDYNYVNYLYSEYTGNPLNDISKYEKQIIKDYREFLSIYNEIKGERKSFLTVEFMLEMLMRKNNVPYDDEDFGSIKTDGSKKIHTNIWNKGCDKLGWKECKITENN